MIARLPNTNSEFVKPVVLSAFMGQEKPMTIKTRLLRTSLYAGVLLAILGSLLANPVFALSFSDIEVGFPDFSEFSTTVQNGDANVLRGVYVANACRPCSSTTRRQRRVRFAQRWSVDPVCDAFPVRERGTVSAQLPFRQIVLRS